jgi:hypothetical protein
MTLLCTLLVVVVILLIAIMFHRERVHRAVTADLLDRVMARSYGEYVAATKPGPNRPLRRRVLSDEEMAALEQQTLGAKK